MDKVAGLYDPEYIDFSYPTARDGGNFVFNTYFTVQNPKSEGAVLDRVEGLKSAVLSEFAEIAADPQRYFGAEELEKAKTKLIDQNLYAMESAEDFITDTLTFWWSTATAQYFFAYEANCRDVVWTDISRLLSDYILGGIAKPAPAAAALVRLRSSTAGSDLKMADRIKELGYIKATTDTAFWWQH